MAEIAGGGGVLEPPAGLAGTPLALLQLSPTTLQAIGEAAASCEPGVSTVRLTAVEDQQTGCVSLPSALVPHCREIDIEVGFVCKKCRLAFPGEAGLLGHQRVSCYPGKSADQRGAVRLTQPQYECKLCCDKCSSILQFKRHCDSENHMSRLRVMNQERPHPSPTSTVVTSPPPPQRMTPVVPPPASVSPSEGLSHEMEDVVNQITLLAARAAAESSAPGAPTDSNANIKDGLARDFCQPQDPKGGKRLLHPADVSSSVTSTCSPVAVPSTGQ